MPYDISISNDQTRHAVDEQQLIDAARAVLADSEFSSAMISLAIVDDEAIHELNRQYLDHDWPTDVLSFVLENTGGRLEGEVILSADTAATVADELGCSPAAEQLLYVVHGMLHLVGFDDKSPEDAQLMRAAEDKFLRQFGFEPSVLTDSVEDAEVLLRAHDSSNGANDS